MKKLILFFPVSLLFFTLGCEQKELQNIDDNTKLLQDSINSILTQHQILLDSISRIMDIMDESEVDIKAYKMEQTGSLFESIARQPELADLLISATEMLYFNINELLPISDKNIFQRGRSRGLAFGGLFDAIARQPEAFSKLDSAAAKFLGIYNPSDISNELLEVTKTFSSSSLNEALARQPEADSLFNVICKRYLNFEIPAMTED